LTILLLPSRERQYSNHIRTNRPTHPIPPCLTH
jgi:hypothetical protein